MKYKYIHIGYMIFLIILASAVVYGTFYPDKIQKVIADIIYPSGTDENSILMNDPDTGGICFTAADLKLQCVTPDIIQFYDSIGIDEASAYWHGSDEGITQTLQLTDSQGKPCSMNIKGGIVVSTTC